MQFLQEYMRHPSKIGAVAPSSRHLAGKMTEPIRYKGCKCIIEYGPGTGIFTDQIIAEKTEDTLFLVIEQNEQFYKRLKKRYANKRNVCVIHDDAANVLYHLGSHDIVQADYIVSGLPFTSLPVSVTKEILSATKKAIGAGGRFITFQYTLLKKKYFLDWFDIDDITFELKNFPPAFVFIMKNRQ